MRRLSGSLPIEFFGAAVDVVFRVRDKGSTIFVMSDGIIVIFLSVTVSFINLVSFQRLFMSQML